MPPSTDSRFPETPTIEAELVRSDWGAYKATLTLPGGHDETLAGDDLDAVREQVIGAARGYLRRQVGRPGRLRVQDPDGTWLLGVPLDDSDLVPLTASTMSEPAAATAPRPAAAPRRKPPVLPSRPTITPRRPATSRKRRASRSIGRRVTAGGALLLAVVALIAIADAVQSSTTRRATHHALATARDIPTKSLRTPAVTGPVTTPIASSAPRARPRPRPRHIPVRHRAAPAHHVTHRAALARHVAPHATAPSSSNSSPPASGSTSSAPATSSSTPASTSSTPTPSYTAPVPTYTPPASTGYSNSLPAPGNGPPPL